MDNPFEWWAWLTSLRASHSQGSSGRRELERPQVQSETFTVLVTT